MRYAHLAVWAAVLAAVYGLARPGSAAGHAVVAVGGSLAGVLGGGLA
jgi:hypothetical protein